MNDKIPLRTQVLRFLNSNSDSQYKESQSLHTFAAFVKERTVNGKLINSSMLNFHSSKHKLQPKVSHQKAKSLYQREIFEEKAIDQILQKKGLSIKIKEEPQNLEVKFFNLNLNVHQKADNYQRLQAAKRIKLPHLRLLDTIKNKSLSPPPLGIYDPNYNLVQKKLIKNIVFHQGSKKKRVNSMGFIETRYSKIEQEAKKKGGRIYEEKLMNELIAEILSEQKQLRLQLIQDSCKQE